MGSSVAPLSTTSSSTTPLTAGPLTFTGVSSYSNDLQSILTRASQIAQLPITNLENQETDNVNKKAALVALNPAVAALGSAVAALGSLASNGGGVTASSSDSTTVSVTNTGATSPATYTVSSIQSLASSAWATTSGFADTTTAAVSADGHVDLTVGTSTYHLDLTGTGNNNLTGLANAINSAGAGVTANILTTSNGDYLSISANSGGQAAIRLQSVPSPVDLITNTGIGGETTLAPYASSTSTPVSMTGGMSLVVGSATYQLRSDRCGRQQLDRPSRLRSTTLARVSPRAFLSDPQGTIYLSLPTIPAPKRSQLNDNSVNLITNSNAGSNADFMLNGNIHIVQGSNVVNNVVPGVSFTLEKTTTGTNSVTLSLANDPSQISTALQTFVNNYNTLAAQVAQQVGTSAGPLDGDTIIQNIMSDTQQIASYWNPSGRPAVSAAFRTWVSHLPIYSGQLTFDPTVFNDLSHSAFRCHEVPRLFQFGLCSFGK